MSETIQLDVPIVHGGALPASHGYELYSALSQLLGAHLPDDVAIGSIKGLRGYDGTIHVMQGAHLRLRLAADRIPLVLPLAGQFLNVGGKEIQLGIPKVRALEPAPLLHSYMVTIKGFMEPEPFLDAARRQLEALGVEGQCRVGTHSFGERQGEPLRRVLRIKNQTVVGFGMEIEGLSSDHSKILLIQGLGGRRRMGCGFFEPMSDH